MIEANLAINMDYENFKNIYLSFYPFCDLVEWYIKTRQFFSFSRKKNGNRKTPKATFFELIFHSTSGEMLLIKKADNHLFEP